MARKTKSASAFARRYFLCSCNCQRFVADSWVGFAELVDDYLRRDWRFAHHFIHILTFTHGLALAAYFQKIPTSARLRPCRDWDSRIFDPENNTISTK